MHRYSVFLLVILVLLAARVSAEIFPITPPQPTYLKPTQLFPSLDLFDWYETTSGYSALEESFGVYVTLPLSDTLYLGFSGGFPTQQDGALLTSTDGRILTAIGPLEDQGVHDMRWWNNQLQISGTDPCCITEGWDWESGNHYVWRPASATLSKYRSIEKLPNVIHTWASEVVDDYLYIATSGHAGDPAVREGVVWRSLDGVDWERVQTVSGFRAYEIVYFGEQLWIITQEERDGATYVLASADFEDWSDVVLENVDRGGLLVWKDQLIALSLDRQTLHAIDGNQHVIDYPLPFRIGTEQVWVHTIFHTMAVDGRYFYAVVQLDDVQNGIVRSDDLQNWDLLLETDEVFASLQYWPAKDALVYGTIGREGKLFTLPLKQNKLYIPFVSQSGSDLTE